MTDTLEHRVGAVAAGEVADPLDAFLASLGYDVGCAELAAEIRPVGWRPIRMICSAPNRLAASTADSPTAPSPMTVTVVRSVTPAVTAQ